MDNQMETGSETEQRQLRELRLGTANTELRAATPFLGLRKVYWDEALDRPILIRTRRVVAIVPAHNEQDGIAVSIGSLLGQTRPADSVIVIIDNCTDDTRELAWAAGAEVVDSVDNTDRKAGALNLA